MKQLCIVIPFLFWLSGCSLVDQVERVKAPEWDPSLAVALVQSSVTLADALEQLDSLAFLEVADNGELVLKKEVALFEGLKADILEVPNFAVPMIEQAMELPEFGLTLDVLTLREGIMTFEFAPQEAVNQYSLLLSCPKLQRNGEPFKQVYSLEGNQAQQIELDLADYTFDFSDGPILLAYQADRLPNNELLNIGIPIWTFKDMRHAYAQGYFGQHDLAPAADSGTIDLGLKLDQAQFQFEDPQLIFSVENEIGIPMEVEVASLTITGQSGSTYPLTGPTLATGIPLNFPASPTADVATTEVVLDRQGTNIREVLTEMPQYVNWDFRVLTHPDSTDGPNGFISQTAGMQARADLILPLKLTIDQLQISSTEDISIPELEVAQAFTARILLENGFPFDADLQVYFLDEGGNRTDSLFVAETNFFQAAIVDEKGEVVQASEQTIEVSLTEAQLAHLADAVQLEWISHLQTKAGQGAVQFSANQGIDVKIGLQLQP